MLAIFVVMYEKERVIRNFLFLQYFGDRVRVSS